MALLLYLVLSLVMLNFLRDILNRYIYRFFHFVLKDTRVATMLFALEFLPGVALHEISHWLMAKVLLVKTHHFSLVPSWVGDGTLRFGSVEVSKTDRLRSAFIAIAPLLSGVGMILWLAFNHLHLDTVMEGILIQDWEMVQEGLKIFLSAPDLFLWLYLMFTISNTMLPSSTDHKVWLPIGIMVGVIYIVVVVISLGSTTSNWLMGAAKRIIEVLLQAFTIANVLNIGLLFPLLLLGKFLTRVRRTLSLG
jgi:hypothetical protein